MSRNSFNIFFALIATQTNFFKSRVIWSDFDSADKDKRFVRWKR
jgi:hypothetical protein